MPDTPDHRTHRRPGSLAGRRARRAVAAVAMAAVLAPAAGPGLTADRTTAVTAARPAAPAPAASAAPSQLAGAGEPLGPVPPLHPDLERVRVSSPGYRAAVAERDRAAEALTTQTRIRDEQASAALWEATNVLRLTDRVAQLDARVRRLTAKELRFEALVRDMAVARYVAGSDDDIALALDMDTSKHMEADRQRILSAAVREDHRQDLANVRYQLSSARAELKRTRQALQAARERLADHERRRDEAAAAAEVAGRDLLAAVPRVDQERRTAMVDGLDFPLVVLDAYLKAADGVADRCGLPWWALAGIGKTESGHGTAQDAQVRADGSLSSPIVGIPLRGGPNLAYIHDSDDGAIDGDPTIDRAAGPMQFIPSTWKRWATDGDGDGDAQSQSFYDAAATAAAYLCAGGPIHTDDDLRRAFFSYNHWDVYVMVVLDRAHAYQAAGY